MRSLLLGLILALVGCTPVSGQGGQQAPSAPAQAVLTGPVLAPRPRAPETFRMWRFRAPVVPVALSADGTLVPPADPAVLGWWGKPAGARHGVTLLTGHSVHTGGGELQTLDRTPLGSIARVSGICYRVRSVAILTHEELAARSAHLFGQAGAPRLVVVTCARYDWSRGVWTQNTVVIADRAPTGC